MRRRDFLGRAAALSAGVAFLGRTDLLAEGPAPRSVVVKVVRDAASAGKKLDAACVREMVHAAVCKLSGKAKPEDAWKCYVRPDDVVGVKINCLFGVGAATHPEVTTAVVEGCRMAGVPDDKIIVWDRDDKHLEKSGYTVNRGSGVRYLGVGADWEEDATDIHTCKGRLAKVLTRQCTALINVPILKHHAIAGITFSMKNHYGSFHNPNSAHGGGCDPFIACLNALKVIREKTRLIVGDALLPVADGGPQANPKSTWEYKAILAATDTVAIDYIGLKILDEQRATIQKPLLEGGKAKCIATAAGMGLGVADLAKIELVTA
jgi:uncharacterized protein (DUF362 family)